MIRKIIAEYKWLEFVDRHFEHILDREQCEFMTIIMNCKMTFRERLKMYLSLRLGNKLFLLFVFIPIVIFCESYDYIERKLK